MMWPGWGVFGNTVVSLSSLLPFFALIESVLYGVYLWFGSAALMRDYKVSPKDDFCARYVKGDLPHAMPIELMEPELSLQVRDSYPPRDSWYHSSVAEISEHTSVTMQTSTRASTSLVNPDSLRSSMVQSGDSSFLPAYSERSSVRYSSDEQTQHVLLAHLDHVHLRRS